MTIRHMPIQTFSLLLTVIGLYFLAPDQSPLYFNAAKIASGETWRIVTGHFMHSDPGHLFWNGLGLAVLGSIIERHSPTLWWAALCAGVASVSILLMTPFAQLDNYCGLSGTLNTLLLVAIWIEWRITRSWMVIAIACGSFAKVWIEISAGTSLLTHISWPPFAWSHAAGLAGGMAVVWWARSKSFRGYRWWELGRSIERGETYHDSKLDHCRK